MGGDLLIRLRTAATVMATATEATVMAMVMATIMETAMAMATVMATVMATATVTDSINPLTISVSKNCAFFSFYDKSSKILRFVLKIEFFRMLNYLYSTKW